MHLIVLACVLKRAWIFPAAVNGGALARMQMPSFQRRYITAKLRLTIASFMRLALIGSFSVIGSFAPIGLAVPPSYAEPQRETASPFAPLAGSWSGGGLIKMKDGAQERLRCTGTYEVGGGGDNLRQELRCASDSYKFEMSSNISEMGGQLAGTWSENTRHLGGRVTGSASGRTIRARAEGDTFTALLAVTTEGNRQSVTISSPGSDISEVSITLTRGSR
jgi:hypothetical protein